MLRIEYTLSSVDSFTSYYIIPDAVGTMGMSRLIYNLWISGCWPVLRYNIIRVYSTTSILRRYSRPGPAYRSSGSSLTMSCPDLALSRTS